MSKTVRVPERVHQQLKSKQREGETMGEVVERHISEEATVWEESELRELAREEAHTVIQQEARR